MSILDSNIFNENIEEIKEALIDYYPTSKNNLWKNKSNKNSNLYQFIVAEATCFIVANRILERGLNELRVTTTKDLIKDWEKQVAIPDGIFETANKSIEDRINQVVVKLKNKYNDKKDFEAIAKLLGFDVTLKTWSQKKANFGIPATIPFTIGGSSPTASKEDRFTLWVEINKLPNVTGGLPITIPFTIPTKIFSDIDVLKTLFERIKPINVLIIYENK